MLGVVDGMVERGYPWLTFLSTVDPANPRKQIARRLVDKGGVPILRPFRQPCHPTQLNLNDDFLRAFRDEGGVRLVIIGNEPNLSLECTKEAYKDYQVGNLTGKEAFAELMADQWLRNADQVRRLGMIPLFPALAPTGEDSNRAIPHHWLYNRIIAVLKGRAALEWAFEGTGLAIHNRPCDGSPLDETHSCSANDHRWIQERFEREGLHLPMYGTEAGFEDGYVVTYLRNVEHNFSPSVDQILHRHKELNQELLRRFRLDHPKAWSPQWKCACLWLAADGAWWGSGIVSNGRRNGQPSDLWRDWQELTPFHRWGDAPPPDPDDDGDGPVEPDPIEPQLPSAVDYDGLSEEMIAALSITGPERPDEPYWKITRIELQPQTDKMCVYAILPASTPFAMQVFWGNGESGWAQPKADQYEAEGAREWAASQPLFRGGWGNFGIRLNPERNAESLWGVGLYEEQDGQIVTSMTGHHPTLVYFQLVEPGPEPPPDPEPGPEPGPGPDVSYRLVKALNERLEAAGLPAVIDARPEIEGGYVDLALMERSYKRHLGPEDLQSITLHQMGKVGYTLNIMGLARYHIRTLGWPNIGPHFCIEKDGQGYFSKRLAFHGPQAGNAQANRYGISIQVNGRFDIDTTTDQPYEEPTEAQLKTLNCIVQELERFVGGGWGKWHPLPIVPHRCVTATDCPGVLYEEYRKHITGGQWPMLPF